MRISSQIRQINKAVAFIEANLQEEITVADVAAQTDYSLFHFCRLFSKITWFSPFHYLIKRRVHQSVFQLIETDHNISRIAFDYCFNSPETYSRAFRRIMGILPNKFRNIYQDIPANLLMPALSKDDLKFRNQQDFELPEIVDLTELKLIGIMGKLEDKQILRSEFGKLSQSFEIYEKSLKTDQEYLFLGTDDMETKFNPQVAKTISNGKWLKTQFVEKELERLINFILHTWLPEQNFGIDHNIFMIESKQDSSVRFLFYPVSELIL